MLIDEYERDRQRQRPWWFLAAIAGILLGGLTWLFVPERLPASTTTTPVAAGVSLRLASPSDLLFRVGPAQARYVATAMAFFDAYGQGRADTVNAMVTDDVVGGDCDPSTDRDRAFHGRAEFEGWLAGRIAEGDRFGVQHIFNENPDATTGGRVVGVTYAFRDSDPIRRRYAGMRDLRYRPADAAKIVFTEDGMRIIALNLGGCGHP